MGAVAGFGERAGRAGAVVWSAVLVASRIGVRGVRLERRARAEAMAWLFEAALAGMVLLGWLLVVAAAAAAASSVVVLMRALRAHRCRWASMSSMRAIRAR